MDRLAGVVAIACGGNHSLELKRDGTVWGTGYNGNGELGDGTRTDRTTFAEANGISGQWGVMHHC